MHGVRRTRSSLVSEPYDDDFVALWRVLGADTGVCAVLETWQDEGGIGSCVFKKWVHVRNPEAPNSARQFVVVSHNVGD